MLSIKIPNTKGVGSLVPVQSDLHTNPFSYYTHNAITQEGQK